MKIWNGVTSPLCKIFRLQRYVNPFTTYRHTQMHYNTNIPIVTNIERTQTCCVFAYLVITWLFWKSVTEGVMRFRVKCCKISTSKNTHIGLYCKYFQPNYACNIRYDLRLLQSSPRHVREFSSTHPESHLHKQYNTIYRFIHLFPWYGQEKLFSIV